MALQQHHHQQGSVLVVAAKALHMVQISHFQMNLIILSMCFGLHDAYHNEFSKSIMNQVVSIKKLNFKTFVKLLYILISQWWPN
jgi:hypothetical protein